MNKIKIFELSIWSKILNNITQHTIDEAFDFCIQLSSRSRGVIFSNIGGWQSDHLNLDFVVKTPLEPIFDVIVDETDLIIEQYNDLVTEYTFSNLWINVNKKDNFNGIHTHPESIISGVYYLSDNNSPIEFVFPFNNKNWVNFENPNLIYTPKKNELLLFPSYLPHKVHPNQNESTRISIAFNCASLKRELNYVLDYQSILYD